MTTLPVSTLIQSIVTLIREAYVGPADPRTSWFIDNKPNSGVLGVLSGVSAAEASTSVDGSGSHGTTIAANVEHLRWSLANVNATLQGQPYNPHWGESWELVTAGQAQWDSLRQSLRAEYETLCGLLEKQERLEGDYLNGVIALIPHAAYHLGSIRQMIERARENQR